MTRSAGEAVGDAVDVVIINHNTREALRACLESIEDAVGVGTVWVGDNGSIDGSLAMVREAFPDVRVRSMPDNPGYGAAANDLIARCSSDVVMLLNADVRVERTTIRELHAHLVARPDIAVAGPRLLHADGTLQRSTFVDPTIGELLWRESGMQQWRHRIRPAPTDLQSWAHDCSREVPWVLGAAMAVHRRAFVDVGGFDIGYFLYFEEADLCHRLRTRGWSVQFVASAVATHVGGVSTGQQPELAQRTLYRSLRRYHELRGGASPPILRASVAAIMTARLVRDVTLGAVGRRGDRRTDSRQAWRGVLSDAWRDWPSSDVRVGAAAPAQRAAHVGRRVSVIAPFSVSSSINSHGGARAVSAFARAVSRRHHVTVISTIERSDGRQVADASGLDIVEVERPPPPAHGRRLRLLVAALRGQPAWAVDWKSPSLRQAIDDHVTTTRPDILHVEYVVMSAFLPEFGTSGPAIVLTDHDPPIAATIDQLSRDPWVMKPYRLIELQAWIRIQRRAAARAAVVVVFDHDDRRFLERFRLAAPIVVVPLSIPLPSVALDPAGYGQPTIAFVGSHVHPPNRDALRSLINEIMPRLWNRHPNLRLLVIGTDPPRFVRDADSRVVATGFVDDLAATLDAVSVVVAPLVTGRGMRVKVLEALAYGKAVVGTTRAVRGLPVAALATLEVADGVDDTVEAISRLLVDDVRRSDLGRSARQWAETWLSPDAISQRYDDLYDLVDLLEGARR